MVFCGLEPQKINKLSLSYYLAVTPKIFKNVCAMNGIPLENDSEEDEENIHPSKRPNRSTSFADARQRNDNNGIELNKTISKDDFMQFFGGI